MDTLSTLYGADETELKDLGIDPPRWIEQDLDTSQLAAIIQGGCASGAYMPAVTYHTARQTMAEHGDDVLDFLEDYDDLQRFSLDGQSWSGFACTVLSAAVEAWAHSVEEEAVQAIEAAGEEE